MAAVLTRRGCLSALLWLSACASRPDEYSLGQAGQRMSRDQAQKSLVAQNLSVQATPPLDAPLRLLEVTLPAYPLALKRRDKVPPLPVTVAFLVSERGDVSDASVVGAAEPEVASVCVQAVRLWRFEPLRRGGQPTTQRFRFQFLFQLED
jgi:TonB family protein